jgi:hypothetical protein
MLIITIHDAKTNLSYLIKKAAEGEAMTWSLIVTGSGAFGNGTERILCSGQRKNRHPERSPPSEESLFAFSLTKMHRLIGSNDSHRSSGDSPSFADNPLSQCGSPRQLRQDGHHLSQPHTG